MTPTELRYIVAVAEKTFGKVVELFFNSTNSVSIKKLEDELSAKFLKGGTEVTLTDVGERLVKQAQLILDESNKMKAIADQADPLLGF